MIHVWFIKCNFEIKVCVPVGLVDLEPRRWASLMGDARPPHLLHAARVGHSKIQSYGQAASSTDSDYLLTKSGCTRHVCWFVSPNRVLPHELAIGPTHLRCVSSSVPQNVVQLDSHRGRPDTLMVLLERQCVVQLIAKITKPYHSERDWVLNWTTHQWGTTTNHPGALVDLGLDVMSVQITPALARPV